jgi:hypothetical protein
VVTNDRLEETVKAAKGIILDARAARARVAAPAPG